MIEVEIDGKKYKFGMLTIKDVQDLEDYVKSKQLKIYLDAGGNDPAVIRSILGQAFDREQMGRVLAQELFWIVKRSLEKEQKITDQEVEQLLSPANLEKLVPVIRKVLGQEEEGVG